MSNKTKQISLRMTPNELSLIETGAALAGQHRNSFIRDVAMAAAAEVTTDRKRLTLDPETWDRLMDAVSQPPNSTI